MPVPPEASLDGTLQGGYDPAQAQILLQMQAIAQQQQDALAASTQAAQQGASQAAQAYQQAAAQPAPGPDMAQFLTMLGGNTASVLGGTPSYRENAQQVVQRSRAEQLKQRADNLQALQDVALQKAQAAQRAGDLETEHKFRSQIETLGKQLDVLQTNHKITAADEALDKRLKAQADLQAQRDAKAAERQAAKEKAAGTASPDDVAAQARTDIKGNKYVDISEWPAKERPGVMAAASKAGLLALRADEAKTLQGIDHAIQNIEDVKTAVSGFAAKDFLGRPQQLARVTWAKVSQSDPAIASYPALQLAAINNVLAQVPPGHGFRLNEAEIKRSLANDLPKDTDSWPVAQRKIEHQQKMIENLRNTIVVRDRSTLAGGSSAPASRTASTPAPTAPAAVKPVGRLVRMLDRNNKLRVIDAAEVQDAITKGGWKRAPAK